MESAIKRIELVAKGKLDLPKADGGFFGFGGGEDVGPDPYAGKNQAELAQALYAAAKKGFNDYVTVVNKSIYEVNPIDPIP